MKIVGTILIAASIGAAFWWLWARGGNARRGALPAMAALCGLGVLAGMALILQDRITEITFPGGGTLKAVTTQAIADATTIAKLKDRVENQSATVDLVATQASTAKALAQQAEDQTKQAAQKLGALDKAIAAANATLAQLRSEADFTQLVEEAQNDDREAFDRLEQLANDKSNPISSSAEPAWITIFKEHSQGMYQSGFSIPWISLSG